MRKVNIQIFDFQNTNKPKNPNKSIMKNNNNFDSVLEKSKLSQKKDADKKLNKEDAFFYNIGSSYRNIKNEHKNSSSEKFVEENDSSIKEEKELESLIESLSYLISLFQNVENLDESKTKDAVLEEVDIEILTGELNEIQDILKNLEIKKGLGSGFKGLIKDLEVMVESLKNNHSDQLKLKDINNLIDIIDNYLGKEENINFKDIEVDIFSENMEDMEDMDSLKEEYINPSKTTETQDEKEGTIVKGDLNNTALIEQSVGRFDNKQVHDIKDNIVDNIHNVDIDKNELLKQISSKIKLNYNDNINEIKIKLSPEHLGNLTIKVSMERGIITARALVENFNVKNTIESNIDILKENLKAQGIEFENIDVSVGQDSENQKEQTQKFLKSRKVKILKRNTSQDIKYENMDVKINDTQINESGLDITI